jgi:hypothetical protein
MARWTGYVECMEINVCKVLFRKPQRKRRRERPRIGEASLSIKTNIGDFTNFLLERMNVRDHSEDICVEKG